ncbi:MAG: aldo/keto reductase [Bacteroidetes bacterium]|jgi:aryl-alcohol dehydrogenase-like predicted oxidoreductase|nr:aldo/keto reductase [Bacteroidota bacterium]MCA6442046.1 aldo/keto reductase [Bacteroidota bacterium]
MEAINKLILGAVQLGLKYGINNLNNKLSETQVFEILNVAKSNGVNILDTANAYGDANTLIGNFHKINQPFNLINKFSNNINSLNDELTKLKVTSFHSYLFHKFSDFENCSNELYERLIQAKQNHKIKNIGVSIYTNSEFETALNCDWIDVVQIPYNVLDNWNLKSHLILKAKSKNKLIHNRSIFLQGLLFMNEANIPEKLKPLMGLIHQIRSICLDNSISINELCLAYSFNNKSIDGVMFGVDTKEQLQQNLDLLSNITKLNVVKATEEVNEKIRVNIDLQPLLNPVNWN